MGGYFNGHKLGTCNHLMYVTREEMELFAGVNKWIQGGGLLASLISGRATKKKMQTPSLQRCDTEVSWVLIIQTTAANWGEESLIRGCLHW